ncbi:hypothetical protein DRO33_02300 [Candidatus Bathyarchaeota archaeon]|nr:MAG: hypothetical protein DRO33_02300 [Candidatus Bathyarchaeota archaeon]
MQAEVLLDMMLAASYLLASVACFSISSRIRGSLLSRKFLALGAVWLFGLASTALTLVLRLPWISVIPRTGLLDLVIRFLKFYAPVVLASLLLVSIAMTYSGYVRRA